MTAAAATLAQAPPRGGSATYLYPGHLHAGLREGTVTTILGTCVAVCLWDARALAGGVNHYLLARAPLGEAPGARYGDQATGLLLEAVLAMGAHRANLVAKVFGGMVSHARHSGSPDIGTANVEMALSTLGALRVPVVKQDVGGPRGRKLVFDLATGDVWVKAL